jgi:hypothetical protein
MVLKKFIFELKVSEMMASEKVTLKNEFLIPKGMVDFLTWVLNKIKNSRPADFKKIQATMKKRELSRQEKEDLVSIVFGNDGVDRAYCLPGFDSTIEKCICILRCFFNEDGEIVDAIKEN